MATPAIVLRLHWCQHHHHTPGSQGLDPSGIVAAMTAPSPDGLVTSESLVPSGKITPSPEMLAPDCRFSFPLRCGFAPGGAAEPSGSWHPSGSCIPSGQPKMTVSCRDAEVPPHSCQYHQNADEWCVSEPSGMLEEIFGAFPEGLVTSVSLAPSGSVTLYEGTVAPDRSSTAPLGCGTAPTGTRVPSGSCEPAGSCSPRGQPKAGRTTPAMEVCPHRYQHHHQAPC